MVLGVVLGAVREVVQGLVQGVVEEVVLGVNTNFGIIMSTKASRTPPPPPLCGHWFLSHFRPLFVPFRP